MEKVARGKVTGIKMFKGHIEGTEGEFDTGTVFVEVLLKGKDNKGYASQPFKCTSSDVVAKIKHNEFPLYCELILETQTDGKAIKGSAEDVCTSIRPLKPGEHGHPAAEGGSTLGAPAAKKAA